MPRISSLIAHRSSRGGDCLRYFLGLKIRSSFLARSQASQPSVDDERSRSPRIQCIMVTFRVYWLFEDLPGFPVVPTMGLETTLLLFQSWHFGGSQLEIKSYLERFSVKWVTFFPRHNYLKSRSQNTGFKSFNSLWQQLQLQLVPAVWLQD